MSLEIFLYTIRVIKEIAIPFTILKGRIVYNTMSNFTSKLAFGIYKGSII